MLKNKPRRIKDPAGGLTAAGRAHFLKTEGAHLKPGVKTTPKTSEQMKRKGSFLRRHYAKKAISPLTDDDGKPTRYAKQAHAWGEPVPKTRQAVKRLAKKGADLLAKFHAAESTKTPAKPPRRRPRAGK